MSLSKIAYGLVLTVIIGSVVFLFSTLLPIPGNYEVKVVKSGSMEPAIKTGAIIVMKPGGPYDVNDVVTFNRGSTGDVPTTHRVVAVKEDAGERLYVTKGDSNQDADMGELRESQIFGQVVVDVPFVGYVVEAAKTPTGFLFLIIAPAGIVALEAIITLVKEIIAINRRKKIPGNETSKDIE